jgi:general transcription factor 3C polypeptide 3 (transcription factor C subunit 4)
MQRQADNRHHLVIQAMAFMTKYRQHSRQDLRGVSEVEYNFGRAFHQLGLLSQALVHYDRVFEIAEKLEREKGEDGVRHIGGVVDLILMLFCLDF